MMVTGSGGARFPVVTEGCGPDVVLVHGGGVTIDDYRRLRTGLAQHFTVHAFDRRGRGEAPPMGPRDDLRTYVDDIGAVLDATGASMVFGHSVGAFFALTAARELPVSALALYDPAVFVDDLFPTDFLPAFFDAARRGQDVEALAIATRGLQNPGAALPAPVRRTLVRAFLRTRLGRRMADLLPTVVHEDELALQHAGPADAYAGVTARSLFVAGSRSPRYYGPLCDRLAESVPHGRSARLALSAHDAPNIARPALVEMLASHYATEA